MRGHRLDAEAGTEFVGDPVRQRDSLLGRYDRPLRRGPERMACAGHPDPHPFADPADVDTRADRVDRACAVLVRDAAGTLSDTLEVLRGEFSRRNMSPGLIAESATRCRRSRNSPPLRSRNSPGPRPSRVWLASMTMRGWSYRYVGPAELRSLVRPDGKGQGMQSQADFHE
jgi:hypothetical protein